MKINLKKNFFLDFSIEEQYFNDMGILPIIGNGLGMHKKFLSLLTRVRAERMSGDH